ncbi:kynureninase [Nocardioides dubius]|uniref:Kynureninase n=1 Tax=Nocardioides dubius TaxID=317019 RepID=A0ABN1U4I7_9ACTN
MDLSRRAAELDAADPIAHFRSLFEGSDSDLVYLDGNSLGRPLRAVRSRLDEFVTGAWGSGLIRSWDEEWMELPFAVGDRIGVLALGAAPGQTVVADSTSVMLYKLLRAAVDRQQALDPARCEIVVDEANFPTDRYLVEGIAAERGLDLRWLTPSPELSTEQVTAALGPRTAVVLLSHITYQSGQIADVAAITAAAHRAGALVLWDLCHSAGAVPIELDRWQVDLAVGCTYKYLNGGPGSPAFGYVAVRHQAALRQPLQGWMGHAEPFVMGPGYRPADGMRRFLTGTPPVLAMQPLIAFLDVFADAGIEAVRAKGVALTEFAIAISDELLAPLGVQVGSPRAAADRGNHVLLRHPRMREVTAALWQRDVIPDFREPDGLRIGLSPLSTSFAEVARGLSVVAELLTARLM